MADQIEIEEEEEEEDLDYVNQESPATEPVPIPDSAIQSLGDEAITGWSFTQWTKRGASLFPAGASVSALTPGLYDIGVSQQHGLYFTPVPVKTEGILMFPDTPFEKIMHEVKTFWAKEEVYRKYGIAYKRGVLLWGPPGAGKTSLIQLVMRDVISRGGVGINFTHPSAFAEAFRSLRAIQPNTPVVVLMEDIDEILKEYSKSSVLDILDGAERVDKIIFLASTNFPELLEKRIANRPSRFDRRWFIDYPSKAAREYYIKYLLQVAPEAKLNIRKMVADTDKMTFAHIKELFVAVAILQDNYEEVLDGLKKMMTTKISSEQYEVMSLKGLVGLAGKG